MFTAATPNGSFAGTARELAKVRVEHYLPGE
jgi:hypothetical protein